MAPKIAINVEIAPGRDLREPESSQVEFNFKSCELESSSEFRNFRTHGITDYSIFTFEFRNKLNRANHAKNGSHKQQQASETEKTAMPDETAVI